MRARKVVATIIAVYNLLGFLALFGLYPKDPFYWDGSILLLLLTFPITIISFGLRYSDPSTLLPFIVQILIFAITLFIGDIITKWIVNRRNK